MTDRLYYADPYLQSFDATVRRVERRAGNDDRITVVLDRTAFYPTSGGQPFDTGTLGGLGVAEVVDEDDGSVAHLLDVRGQPGPRGQGSGMFAEGQRVHGVIDWDRRFDHMQQHTGQHVLSAAFEHLFQVRTMSFHLGAGISTIDLAREMSAAEIAAAETEANRIVWENRPVAIRFVTQVEAAAMPLRKEPQREGTLRVIEVEGFDLSACGGTHVARTGAIGVIAVASWQRFKGGQRLEFLCGRRALDRFRVWRDILTSSTRLLSVPGEELPAAIERMQAEAKERTRSAIALQKDLSRYQADELAAAAEPTAAGRLTLRAIEADAEGLKALAAALTSRPGHVAVLASTSTPALVVVARSADLAIPAHRVLAALTSSFGGRGGGKAELAQGGGLNAPADTILAAARAAIVSA